MGKRLGFWDAFLVLQLLVTAALVVNVTLAASAFHGEAEPADFKDLDVTLITVSDCPTCFDLAPLKDYLAQNGVEDAQIKEVAYDSRAGEKLLGKYEVTKVPTAIITGPHGDYEFMAGLVGTIAEVREDALVVTEIQPPYLDLAEHNIRGEFDVVYVTDTACTECYDIALHEGVLERMAMKPTNTSSVDISTPEGQELVGKYVLTSVPTILLRGDLEPFKQLQEIWSAVGTIEEDGTYVLRQGVASMGTYKRLPDGELIKPEPEST